MSDCFSWSGTLCAPSFAYYFTRKQWKQHEHRRCFRKLWKYFAWTRDKIKIKLQICCFCIFLNKTCWQWRLRKHACIVWTGRVPFNFSHCNLRMRIVRKSVTTEIISKEMWKLKWLPSVSSRRITDVIHNAWVSFFRLWQRVSNVVIQLKSTIQFRRV